MSMCLLLLWFLSGGSAVWLSQQRKWISNYLDNFKSTANLCNQTAARKGIKEYSVSTVDNAVHFYFKRLVCDKLRIYF